MRFHEFGKIKRIEIEETIPEEFTDINGETNFLDYLLVLEAEASGKLLSENIDPQLVNQIEKLSSLGINSPEVGQRYIPAFVFYLGGKQIRIHGSATPLELKDVKDEEGLTIYDFGGGRKYPNKRLSAASYGRLFLFDNQSNFNKFMDVMSLRFNVSQLSESKQTINEAKVGREYQHLEDLVFVDGSAGAIKAANILDDLGEDASDVSIKWDGCVHPDLLIETNKGKFRIEEVIDRVNNQEEFTVMSRNLKTNSDEFTPILNAVKKYGPKTWVEVVLGNDEVLRLTEDHEVYTTNRGWVEAKDLTPADDIKTL